MSDRPEISDPEDWMTADPHTDQEVAIEFPIDDEGRVWLCQCGVWGTGRERCWTCGSESLRPAVMQARGASEPSTDRLHKALTEAVRIMATVAGRLRTEERDEREMSFQDEGDWLAERVPEFRAALALVPCTPRVELCPMCGTIFAVPPDARPVPSIEGQARQLLERIAAVQFADPGTVKLSEVVAWAAAFVGGEPNSAEADVRIDGPSIEGLQGALTTARADMIGVLNAGFDSTRREVATRAIERLDAALSAVPSVDRNDEAG